MTSHVASRAIYIVAARRTACGDFGGKLKDMSATDLGVHSTKAALESINLPASAVDTIVMGNVIQSGSDAIYLTRHIALRSGMKIETPSLIVNRLCGSGFQAVVSAAQSILLGESSLAVAGGTESMSNIPHAVRGIRWGTKLGSDIKLEDALWASVSDPLCKMAMGLTAENLAVKYNITRSESDAFAVASQQKWGKGEYLEIHGTRDICT